MPDPESTPWTVPAGEGQTVAVFDAAESDPSRVVFVFAHGAGGNRDDRSMLAARDALRARGISTVRFNFLYKERGSGRPDAMPLLQETVSAVVARTREELRPELLIIGGRSMGGRAASMLAADGFACDGLLLLAYPLHPAGQPEKLRDAHLPSIHQPVLCFNGTRDELCRPDLMEAVLQRVGSNWRMHWLEAAQVLDEMGDATRAWVDGLGSGA
jgi:predicted alpha/beta-hydrolase family hydrolase